MKEKIPSLLFKVTIITLLVYIYKSEQIPYHFLRTCIILLIFASISQIFHLTVIKGSLKNIWKNTFLLVYVFGLFFIIDEIYFTFYSKSHAVTFSMASENWFKKYWNVNSLGYRDAEVDTSEKRKKIFFIGDSFTAGHGTNWTKDRFGNIFASKISDSYKVYNLGVCGSDTRDEFKRLQSFPVKPEIVIWQYFGNDMEGVLRANNIKPPGFKPYNDLPTFTKPLFANSYFLNFIYWQLPHSELQPFFSYLSDGYKNEKVFDQHLEDLEKVVAYCEKNNIKLVVILFPYLQDLNSSSIYVPRIKGFFEKNCIPVLDVTPLVENLTLKERIANNNDVHPSVKVNSLVGENIYKLCKEKKIIQ